MATAELAAAFVLGCSNSLNLFFVLIFNFFYPIIFIGTNMATAELAATFALGYSNSFIFSFSFSFFLFTGYEHGDCGTCGGICSGDADCRV